MDNLSRGQHRRCLKACVGNIQGQFFAHTPFPRFTCMLSSARAGPKYDRIASVLHTHSGKRYIEIFGYRCNIRIANRRQYFKNKRCSFWAKKF